MFVVEILTPLSGNPHHFRNWNKAIKLLEIDNPAILHILDNSNSQTFNDLVKEESINLKEKFMEVSIDIFLEPFRAKLPDFYMEEDRHAHVAKLYSKLFSNLKGNLALTFEEDIIPKPDAFRRLLLNYDSSFVGAIGGAYSAPQNKDVVCAGIGFNRWEISVPWKILKGKMASVDFIGGGFTLWNLSGLDKIEIRTDWNRLLGWDAILCEQLRNSGLKIILAGDVICQHNNKFLK